MAYGGTPLIQEITPATRSGNNGVVIVVDGMRKVRDYVPEMKDNQERKP